MKYTRHVRSVGRNIAMGGVVVGSAHNIDDARLWANAWKLAEAVQQLLKENTRDAWDNARKALRDAIGDEKALVVKHRGSNSTVVCRLKLVGNRWRCYRVGADGRDINWQVTVGVEWGDEAAFRMFLESKGWKIVGTNLEDAALTE